MLIWERLHGILNLKGSLGSCCFLFPPDTVNTTADSCCLCFSEKSATFSKICPRVVLIIPYLPSWTIRFWHVDLFKCNPLKLLSDFWKFGTSHLHILSPIFSASPSHFACRTIIFHYLLKLYSLFLIFFYCFLRLYIPDGSMYDIVSCILFLSMLHFCCCCCWQLSI